jgi:hypothetical protein
MKTKIKNFLQVLTLHSVSFVLVFAVGFTALGAWNWSTRVSDGDTLTSEKWNAVIAQLEAVEQKASSAEAKAVTAQNTANSIQNVVNNKTEIRFFNNNETAPAGFKTLQRKYGVLPSHPGWDIWGADVNNNSDCNYYENYQRFCYK